MAETEIRETLTLDARGLLCPMPIVKTAKAMKGLAPGDVLKVMSTDRGSIADMPAWSQSLGHELLEWHEDAGTFTFFIRKGTED